VAAEAEQLRSRRAQLQREITRLREGGGSLSADPVAELFAWLSRGQLNVHDIAFGFPLIFACLIEAVSALGLPAIIAYADATKREPDRTTTHPDMSRSDATLPALTGYGEVGRVIQWMAERTEPTGNSPSILIDELHADYEVWCVSNGLEAV